jgi:hypothetical protein
LSEVHEFTVMRFLAGVDESEQRRALEGLGRHLADCPGMIRRECFHSAGDGRWVEHVIWASEAELEASSHLEDDPEASALYERIDDTSVVYVRGAPAGI